MESVVCAVNNSAMQKRGINLLNLEGTNINDRQCWKQISTEHKSDVSSSSETTVNGEAIQKEKATNNIPLLIWWIHYRIRRSGNPLVLIPPFQRQSHFPQNRIAKWKSIHFSYKHILSSVVLMYLFLNLYLHYVILKNRIMSRESKYIRALQFFEYSKLEKASCSLSVSKISDRWVILDTCDTKEKWPLFPTVDHFS